MSSVDEDVRKARASYSFSQPAGFARHLSAARFTLGDNPRTVLFMLRQRRATARPSHRASLCVAGIDAQPTGPVRSNSDLASHDLRINALVFFGLFERGINPANRGMDALSLEIDETACDAFVVAFVPSLERRTSLFAEASSLRRVSH